MPTLTMMADEHAYCYRFAEGSEDIVLRAIVDHVLDDRYPMTASVGLDLARALTSMKRKGPVTWQR